MKTRLVTWNHVDSGSLGRMAAVCKGKGFPICEDDKDSTKRYKKCVKAGHHSILRHCHFTFWIEGVSKKLSHQLVRHKFLDVTQKSDSDGVFEWSEAAEGLLGGFCSSWPKKDIPMIDAKDRRPLSYLSPHGSATEMLVSGSLQAWREFLEQRLCRHALPEINKLALKIYRTLNALDPLFVCDLRGNKGRCQRNCPECLMKPKSSKKVIAFSGKMLSGKTTAAHHLSDRIPGSVVLKFADPIYDVCKEYHRSDEKDRRLLQSVGKKMRDYDKDVFAKMMVETIKKRDHLVIIDDLRYINERGALKDAFEDVVVVAVKSSREERLKRGELIGENDISELDCDTLEIRADVVIENNGSLEELVSKLNEKFL